MMRQNSSTKSVLSMVHLTTPLEVPEETLENQAERQDPRYRGPEEGKYAKRTYMYSIEACTAKMDWSCYKNA